MPLPRTLDFHQHFDPEAFADRLSSESDGEPIPFEYDLSFGEVLTICEEMIAHYDSLPVADDEQGNDDA